MKTKIVFLYPYYWPLYQAGGPVQSLFNLAGILKDKAEVWVISKSADVDGSPLKNHPRSQWTDGINGEKIWYQPFITPGLILRQLQQIKPDLVFVNGVFNASTTLPGIFFSRWLGIKIIFSPRGMLQTWGLKQNRLLKMAYLFVVKLILPPTLQWHATDLQEKEDIVRVFGNRRQVHLAGNIPRKIIPYQHLKWRTANEKIKLIFLSLINPNKNLHAVIGAVRQQPEDFSLDIYGPAAHLQYWKLCLEKMKGADNILYHGPVEPWTVQELLGQFHFFVLPTQGENFGHAIFDSLSSSVPVIVSRNVPWKNIDQTHAGYYIHSNEDMENGLTSILNEIQKLSDQSYRQMRESAYHYAVDYWNTNDFINQYQFLLEQQ